MAAREHGVHEPGALCEIAGHEVLGDGLLVSAEVLQGAAHGPVAEELVGSSATVRRAWASSASWSPPNAW